MAGLRERVFAISPADLDLTPGPGQERVWTVLMETGYPEAVASLVTIADGTTSIYFSSGGGIIGAGEHQSVREASARLIALVDAHLDELEPTSAHPLPSEGRVRFYARTFDDLRTAEADEEMLGEGRHPLSPLFHAAHEVIATVREATPPE
jgi:hypothetical protein